MTTDEKDKKDTIHVTVSIDATANAAGIGFSVDGKETGGAGSSYTGVGPANKEYSFGYRKGLKTSENISCGTLTLTKDSKVTLVADGASCRSSVE
ncbi:MAG: hypothetical protein CK423_08040 [Legionella sp.]|nr:MAG: hypothetical protein CK423_08040 [Legionella sp.]